MPLNDTSHFVDMPGRAAYAAAIERQAGAAQPAAVGSLSARWLSARCCSVLLTRL